MKGLYTKGTIPRNVVCCTC